MHTCLAERPCGGVGLPIVMPVPFAVCPEAIEVHLIADVQCKDDGEDAGGGVPSMALKPVVKDILDEGWVVD